MYIVIRQQKCGAIESALAFREVLDAANVFRLWLRDCMNGDALIEIVVDCVTADYIECRIAEEPLAITTPDGFIITIMESS